MSTDTRELSDRLERVVALGNHAVEFTAEEARAILAALAHSAPEERGEGDLALYRGCFESEIAENIRLRGLLLQVRRQREAQLEIEGRAADHDTIIRIVDRALASPPAPVDVIAALGPQLDSDAEDRASSMRIMRAHSRTVYTPAPVEGPAEKVRSALSLLDRELGDSDLPEDDRPLVRACQMLTDVLRELQGESAPAPVEGERDLENAVRDTLGWFRERGYTDAPIYRYFEERASETGRCPVCGWPFAASREHGCVPGDCSYRPAEGTDEYRRIRARRAALASHPVQGAGGGEREGRFSFDVFWSDEDRAYVAALRRPSSWHFSGIGTTPLDAMRELMVPIDMALEDEAASPAPRQEVEHGDR